MSGAEDVTFNGTTGTTTVTLSYVAAKYSLSLRITVRI